MRTGFRQHSAALAAAALLCTFASACVYAQSPEDIVHDLDFRQGDHAIELGAGTLDLRGAPRNSAAFLGVEYGIRDNWTTQLGVGYRREPGKGLRFDAVEWENGFRFLDVPQLPVQIGLLAQAGISDDRDDGYRLRFGPLLQKDIGDLRLNFNLLFERHLDEHPSLPTEIAYQIQANFPVTKGLEVGLQGFGNMGEWDDWAARGDQSHRFGPAVFDDFALGGLDHLEYEAAYLTDPSSSARSHGVKVRLKYRY